MPAIQSAVRAAVTAATAAPASSSDLDDFYIVDPDKEFTEAVPLKDSSTKMDGVDDFVIIDPSDFVFPINFDFMNDAALSVAASGFPGAVVPTKLADIWPDGASVWYVCSFGTKSTRPESTPSNFRIPIGLTHLIRMGSKAEPSLFNKLQAHRPSRSDSLPGDLPLLSVSTVLTFISHDASQFNLFNTSGCVESFRRNII